MPDNNKGFPKQIRIQIIGYITTALGLVAALAWNEAIKDLIAYLFPGDKNSLILKFAYAIIITGLVVVVTSILMKLFKEDEEKGSK